MFFVEFDPTLNLISSHLISSSHLMLSYLISHKGPVKSPCHDATMMPYRYKRRCRIHSDVLVRPAAILASISRAGRGAWRWGVGLGGLLGPTQAVTILQQRSEVKLPERTALLADGRLHHQRVVVSGRDGPFSIIYGILVAKRLACGKTRCIC